MRISDWSSDVCSSDLRQSMEVDLDGFIRTVSEKHGALVAEVQLDRAGADEEPGPGHHRAQEQQVGRRRAPVGRSFFLPGIARDNPREPIDRKSTRLNSSN